MRDTQTSAAISMARQVGDQHALAWTLSVRHRALWGVARSEEMFNLATEMIKVARALRHDELLLDAQLWRMIDRIELGQLAEALHDHREYVAVANPTRSSYHTYMLLILEAAEATSGGQCARAQELSERACELGKQLHEPLAQAHYEVRRLFLQAEPSSASAHAALPKRGSYMEPPSCVPGEYRALWALAWLRSGHEERARALLDELAANAGELPGVSDALLRPVWAVLARIAARLQHRPAAAILYSRLARDADRHLLLQAGVYLGPVSYYLGSLAALLDRTADATRHFEQALQASARSLTFLARTQFEYAQLLARGPGPRRRAEELLHEAEVNARQTGLSDLLEQLKAPFDVTRTSPRASYA
jgi:tetratricopeptide (TPR) repeat protein